MLLQEILRITDSTLTRFSLTRSNRCLSLTARSEKIFKKHCCIWAFLHTLLRSRCVHIGRWWITSNAGAVADWAGCWGYSSVDILLEIFRFLLNNQLLLLLFLTLRRHNNLLIRPRHIHLHNRVLNQRRVIISNRNKYRLLINRLRLKPKWKRIRQMQRILIYKIEIRIVLYGGVYKRSTIYYRIKNDYISHRTSSNDTTRT